MTNQELQQLFETSNARINELAAKYYSGQRLTRQDCDDLRRAVHRQGVIAYEVWVRSGKPRDEMFECFQQGPPKLSPLPASMRPLDLSEQKERGVN